VDFRLTEEQKRLQRCCQELAADFATRSADHDREATHPTENYRRLREEGFYELSVPKEWGGAGAGFLDHTIAFEALAQGCPSTALAFNMHASVVMPLLESSEVTTGLLRGARLSRNGDQYLGRDHRARAACCGGAQCQCELGYTWHACDP